MKYIKYFNEGFFDFLKSKKKTNKIEDSDILYKETSEVEFNKFDIEHKKESFTKNESNILVKKLKKKSFNILSFYNNITFSKESSENSYRFSITKYQDEWYFITKYTNSIGRYSHSSEHYMCDTIEGVNQFISDKISDVSNRIYLNTDYIKKKIGLQ